MTGINLIKKARKVIYGLEKGSILDVTGGQGVVFRRVEVKYKKKVWLVHFYKKKSMKTWVFDHYVEK